MGNGRQVGFKREEGGSGTYRSEMIMMVIIRFSDIYLIKHRLFLIAREIFGDGYFGDLIGVSMGHGGQ